MLCIGGTNGNTASNGVYTTSFSTTGAVNSWTASLYSYPEQIEYQSCVRFLASVYCIAGSQGGYKYVTDTFFTNLTSVGFTKWTPTTPYPLSADQLSCTVYLNYVYCVGGITSYGVQNSTYYATVSRAGIGIWQATTPYPQRIAGASCAAYLGYIYCAGGFNSTSGTNAVYSAPLLSPGIGAWTKTTAYPLLAYSGSCVAFSAHLYCIGGIVRPPGQGSTYTGSVFVAPLVGSGGVGPWANTTRYPTRVAGESCLVAVSGYLDCFGGFDGSNFLASGYYAPVVSITTTTSSITSTVTSSLTTIVIVPSYQGTTTKTLTVYSGTLTTTTTSVSTVYTGGTSGASQIDLGQVSLGAGIAIAAVAAALIFWIRKK
jgi:hypothetical protein